MEIPGFIFLGRLDEIDESHNFLIDNFKVHIRCPECASLAIIPDNNMITCHCKRVKIDLGIGKDERMEGDWLVYVKEE